MYVNVLNRSNRIVIEGSREEKKLIERLHFFRICRCSYENYTNFCSTKNAHLFSRLQLTKPRRPPTFQYQKADIYLTHGHLVSAQLWKKASRRATIRYVARRACSRTETNLPSFLGIKRSNIFLACKGQILRTVSRNSSLA